jgi:hypothetical protein
MADDGGVLGNLPRSRPGHRSEKRTERSAAPAAGAQPGAARRPKKTATTGTASAGAAKPGPARRPKTSAGDRPAPHAGDPVADATPHAGDPVGDAIRTVTGVAATGARVAGGVAREVLRRLPRP